MNEIKGKEKVVIKATKDGLVEENLVTKESKNVSGKKTQYINKDEKNISLSDKKKVTLNNPKSKNEKKVSKRKNDGFKKKESSFLDSKSSALDNKNKSTYQRFTDKKPYKNHNLTTAKKVNEIGKTVLNDSLNYDENYGYDEENKVINDLSKSKYMFSNHKEKTLRSERKDIGLKDKKGYERFKVTGKKRDLDIKENLPKEAKKDISKAKSIQKKTYKKGYAQLKRNGVSIKEYFLDKNVSKKPKHKKGKVKKAIKNIVKNNGAMVLMVGVLSVVVFFMTYTFSSCSLLGSGISGTVSATTYPSSDESIYNAESIYIGLENSLNQKINSIESTYPGYDYYNYMIDEIGHNPYELTSYLTSVYGNYDGVDVSSEINKLFDEQYEFTISESTEKIEAKTEAFVLVASNNDIKFSKENTKPKKKEEKTVKVLNVKLKNYGFDYVARKYLSGDSESYYTTLNMSYGCRDYLWNTNEIYYSGTAGINYTIPPEALSDERFYNMITEAEKYVGYPYVWGGASPETSFDCSGFVSWVINNCGNGWSYGRLTAEGLRQKMIYVPPEEARPGDLIFFQNTYDTVGASHVGIYVGDGMMLHCGDPIKYSSINTSYWQEHFLSFGRIP